jgi:hypothetical protein
MRYLLVRIALFSGITFIEKGGWATLAGATPDEAVARACTTILVG